MASGLEPQRSIVTWKPRVVAVGVAKIPPAPYAPPPTTMPVAAIPTPDQCGATPVVRYAQPLAPDVSVALPPVVQSVSIADIPVAVAAPPQQERNILERAAAGAYRELLLAGQEGRPARVPTPAEVERFAGDLPDIVQRGLTDVRNASKLTTLLPLAILATGIIVKRPILGAALAGVLFLRGRA